MKSAIVLNLALLLSSGNATEVKEPEPIVYGKQATKCEDDLPTLSIASDKILNTMAEWNDFVEKYPFHVVGAADSSCASCCVSEPILRDLEKVVKDKAFFSYPEKHKKQKKIIRKEIGIARIDLANKKMTEALAAIHIWFPMGTTIQIGQGSYHVRFDGSFSDVNQLLHHMQRLANPLVSLTDEDQIMAFLDESTQKNIWEDDYQGQLCPKGQSFDEERKMDTYSQQAGFNTRVLAFFYDKVEYKEEIELLRSTAKLLSARYNLRIGIVSDQRLVTKMKKSHPELFLDIGMNVMVLKRYDGAIFKMDLADNQPNIYPWWISKNSAKPVDKASPSALHVTELIRMPIINIFVDFSTPQMAEKSQSLIKLMEKLAPEYARIFMFLWTDEATSETKRILGVTWDEMPAIALNSIEHIVYAYPQQEPFEKENLIRWLDAVKLQKTAETDMLATDFTKRQRDPTIEENFLEKAIKADKNVFEKTILREDADSIVFFYSTENVNYVQRKAAHQFNLVIETLSSEALYGDMVGHKLKFYSYDVYSQGFPKGVPFGKSPPQDTTGVHVHTEEARSAGVPTIFIFPAGQKNLPYTRFQKFPLAQEIIEFIIDKQQSGIKLKAKDFKELGKRSIDEQAFHRRIDREGVIQLANAYDEL